MVFDFNLKPISTKSILNSISEMDIYNKYYNGTLLIDKKVKSPFREDNHPSFNLSLFNGKLYWRDWGISDKASRGDVFSFVMKMFNISFTEALQKINDDFSLNLYGFEFNNNGEKSSKKEIIIPHLDRKIRSLSTKIVIEKKFFTVNDLNFWEKYGITQSTLNNFNVYPAKDVWIIKNKKLTNIRYTIDNPIYIYEMVSYSKPCYKIYAPYNKIKWLTNCPAMIIQGLKQLIKTGDLLIITKSLKDVMSLHEMGYQSIAPQSETTMIPVDLFNQLRKRFKNIVLFYDNDKTGILMTERFSKLFNIENILIPINSGSKDISDFVKDHSFEEGKNLIKNMLNEKIHNNIFG